MKIATLEKMNYTLSRALVYSYVGFFVIVTAIVFGCIAFFMWSKFMHATCKDFDSYHLAESAFTAGNLGLDGDNDGIPCEELKENSGRSHLTE